MKKVILTVAASLAVLSAAAQVPARNQVIGDVGIGVGVRDAGGDNATFTQRLAVEWGMGKLGARTGWTLGFQLNNGVYAIDNFTQDDLTFMPTIAVHHGFTSRLDAYLTGGLGFGLLNSKYHGHGNTEASFAAGVNVGLRYWLTKQWAVNGQFGMISGAWKNSYGSYNLLSVGLSYRF